MNIDWFTFVAQIINFVILVWLLNRFLYEPITRAMQTRQETVAQHLQDAEDQKLAAQQEKESYEQRSRELESERQQIVSVAREEAAQTRQSLLNEARGDVQARREDWLHSLEREQNSLVDTVRDRVGQHVIAATRSALSQLADVELEERMVNRFAERLENLEPDKLKLLRRESSTGNRVVVETAFELSEPSQQQLQSVLEKNQLGKAIFETDRDLVCGIELHMGGQKIGWSVQEYLVLLADEVSELMTQEA